MQLSLHLDNRKETIEEADKRLRRQFAAPGPWHLPDPVSQLILGLVGGRTKSTVSLRASVALKQRYRTWERLRDASAPEIHQTIHAVTFAEVKARRLKAALQRITTARGGLTLDFLERWPVEEALAWLERLPGVGRKTSAATLNFSTLRMKALVIDTHHLRVLRRLGLVGQRATTLEAYGRIVPDLPAGWDAADFDNHHQRMKLLGQKTCRHAVRLCGFCPLAGLCRTAVRS